MMVSYSVKWISHLLEGELWKEKSKLKETKCVVCYDNLCKMNISGKAVSSKLVFQKLTKHSEICIKKKKFFDTHWQNNLTWKLLFKLMPQ